MMTEYLSDSIYCQAQSRRPLATIPCHQRRSRVAKATAILLVLASSNTQAFIAAPLGAGVAVAGAAPRARSNQSSGWASAGTSHDTRGLTGSMLVSTRRSTAAGGLCVARVARRTSILGKWALKSSTNAESREETCRTLQDNNWGMDESIDVNEIRRKMMEDADDWVELLGDTAKEGEVGEAAVDAATEKLIVDIMGGIDGEADFSSIFEKELEEGQSALKDLADELKGKESSAEYVEKMSREMAELVMAEDKKAHAEVEARMGPALKKVNAEKEELERAMADFTEARAAYEGDFELQLMSFRGKGVVKQSALVAAILVSNQAVYQAIKIANDTGGNPAIAVGGLAVAGALVWFYGYRPFSR